MKIRPIRIRFPHVSRVSKFLQTPWFLMFSIFCAAITGLNFKETAHQVGPLGTLYLNLLQMTVIPVLLTAVISSLGRLVATHGLSRLLLKIVVVMMIGLCIGSLVGIVASWVGQFGAQMGPEAHEVLGRFLNEKNITASPSERGSFFRLLLDTVPTNPIRAISEGKHLSILFFALVLGVALGFGEVTTRETTLRVVEALYEAHLRIIGWTLYALPLGIYCVFSEQIADMGIDILFAMGRFVAASVVLAMIVVAASIGVISAITHRNPIRVMLDLRNVLIVSFVTGSSFATMPTIIEALHIKFRRDLTQVNLLIPIAVNLGRFGSSLYIAFAASFFQQLYHLPTSAGNQILLWGLCVLGGMIPTKIAGLVSVVFSPLGLPTEVGTTLLLAVDPLLNSVFSVVNAFGYCASTSLLSKEVRRE